MQSTANISIALCTFNAGNYLTILLDSLLNQTLPPVEIVVCDDGSTDSTKEVLATYKEKHPQLFSLHFNATNLGYIKNFEQCINLCKSTYIAIADHDDIWRATKLEKLFAAIGDGYLVYCDSQFMSSTGEILDRKLTTQYNFISKPNPKSFIFSNCIWGHACMLKKDIINNAFPIPANAPYDIWLGFIAANVSYISYFNEPLTLWRQHENSYSHKSLTNSKSKQLQAIDDWSERLNWMRILQSTPHNYNKEFIEKLIYLFEQKKNKYSFSLLFFLIKNRKILFSFWRKNEISLLNECRKLCRKIVTLD